MKKTFLIFAGIAVLASCAKEVALDVYEEAPAATGKLTLVAQKGENEDTKVTYDPTNGATWRGNEQLGVFTKKPNTTDNTAWENAGATFNTSKLFAGKSTASFFGDFSSNVSKGSTIYGVYPFDNDRPTVDENKKNSLTFAYKHSDETTFDFDHTIDLQGTTLDEGADRVYEKKDDKGNTFLLSRYEDLNYVILYKSKDTFGPYDYENDGSTPLPSMDTKTMAAKLNVEIEATDESTLKSIKLIAKNSAGETVKFHTSMTLDLDKFDTYSGMTSSNYDPADLYGEAAGEAESLVFKINNYTVEAGKKITLPIILFPTDAFNKIDYVVTWDDKQNSEQHTVGSYDKWGNDEHALNPNIAINNFGIQLPSTDTYIINSIPQRSDDPTHPWTLSTWIADRIQSGFTHIIVDGDGLELEDLETAETYGNVETTAGLIIPDKDKNGAPITKNIIIDAPIKNGTTVTPLVGENYTGTITFNNTATVEDGETYDFIVESANTSFKLTGEYNTVTLKKANEVTLEAADIETLTEGENAEINSLTLTEDSTVKSNIELEGIKKVSISGSISDGVDTTEEKVSVTDAETVTIAAKDAALVYIGKVTKEVTVTGVVDEGEDASQDVIIGLIYDEENDEIEGLVDNIKADITLAGKLNKVAVYTNGGELTVDEEAEITELTIVGEDAEENAIPSVSSVTIKGTVTDAIEVPASARSVNIAENGEVYGLILNNGIETVEIDGKVAGYDADNTDPVDYEDEGDIAPDVDTKTASVVRIGKTAQINGSLTSTPENGTSVKIEGDGTNNAQINGDVTVRNMGTFESKGLVKGNYSLESITTKTDVVLPGAAPAVNTNQVLRFFACDTEINLTSERTTAPQLIFTACTDSDITIDGYKGNKISLGNAATRLNATVTFKNCEPTDEMTVFAKKNIELINGTYNVPVTLNATGDIKISGTKTASTNKYLTLKKDTSLTAENITVGYVKVDVEEGTIKMSMLASGAIKVGDNAYSIDLSKADITIRDRAVGATVTDKTKVVEPESITFTKSTIGLVTSYWDVVFNECTIKDGSLEYQWYTNGTEDDAVKNANGVILFSLNNCKKGNASVNYSDLLEFIKNTSEVLNTYEQKSLLTIAVNGRTFAYTDLEEVAIQPASN